MRLFWYTMQERQAILAAAAEADEREAAAARARILEKVAEIRQQLDQVGNSATARPNSVSVRAGRGHGGQP